MYGQQYQHIDSRGCAGEDTPPIMSPGSLGSSHFFRVRCERPSSLCMPRSLAAGESEREREEEGGGGGGRSLEGSR